MPSILAMEKSSAEHPSGPLLLSVLGNSRGGEAERIDGQLKALISKELFFLLGVLVRCAHQMFPYSGWRTEKERKCSVFKK